MSTARRLALPAIAALAGLLSSSAPASAASACSAAGLTVTPLQSAVFYIDVQDSYLGSYVGYRVTNAGGAPVSGLWERLENFTGAVVGPTSRGTATRPLPLDSLAAGASAPSYFYLQASGATTAPQTHDVVIYDGRPGSGGVELCRQTQTITSVQDVIDASANKVTSTSLSTSADLGGTFQLTVGGQTGTIGAGIASDPGVVRFSPAVAAGWPSSAFRLTSVSHQLTNDPLAVPDVLSRSNMSGASQNYSVTYTFRIVGPTTSATPVVPVSNIASGTQVKHTTPSSFSSLPPIPVVTGSATMTVAAPDPGPYVSGAQVPITATLDNTSGGSPVSVDQLVVHVPAGWSAVPGSATAGGTPVADPYDAGGGELDLVGPFTAPAGGTLGLGLTLAAGDAGTGRITVAGTLAGGQIDSTADPSDDVPAGVDVTVLPGAPVAHDDSATVHAAATDLDVLANDDLAGGTPALAIVDAPQHGTATVADGKVSYTPDAGYYGSDTFTYSLTTGGGTSQATVTLDDKPVVPAPADETSTGTGTDLQAWTLTVPDGDSVTLLDGDGQPVTQLDVPGQGGWSLDPATGTVTFTPEFGFAGQATPVSYRLTDGYGQTGTATLTPTVLAPGAPLPDPFTTTGVATDPQSVTLAIPQGGSVALLGAGGDPVMTVTVDGVGTYTLDPATGVVTFAPVLGFSGDAPAIGYRVTDGYGQTADATWVATVTPPAAPAAPDQSSTALDAGPQSVTLPVPDGATVTLLDAGGNPVTTVAIPGVGTYSVDPATGVVTFTPATGFSGTAPAVTYQVTDAYGQESRGTYTATATVPDVAPVMAPVSVAPPAVQPPAVQPIAAPAPGGCASKRAMTIHWRVRSGTHLRSIRVTVNGHPYKALRGGAREVTIGMQGRKEALVTVVVAGRGSNGRVVRTVRTYLPCHVERRLGPLPTLYLR